jgi:hypothetical protein
MKLAYAIFAENADRLSDGRVCIFGGDVDTFTVSQTPATIPFMLVVKLVADDDESLEGHFFGLDVENPEGKRTRIGGDSDMPVRFNKRVSEASGVPPIAHLYIKLIINFLNPGMYYFRIYTDGAEAARLPVFIGVSESEQPEVIK